jgi:hypothetical protein
MPTHRKNVSDKAYGGNIFGLALMRKKDVFHWPGCRLTSEITTMCQSIDPFPQE